MAPLVIATLTAAAWLVTPAPMEHVAVAPAPMAIVSSRASIFPTTTVTADMLDDLAAEEAAKDAKINARKAAIRKAEEEADAKQAAELAKQEEKKAAEAAKKQAVLEKAAAEKAARVALAAEKAAEKEAAASASGSTKKATVSAASKANKYGTVQTINKQAVCCGRTNSRARCCRD